MNMWVHFLLIFIITLNSIQFGIVLNERSQYKTYAYLMYNANVRMLSISVLSSTILSTNYLTSLSSKTAIDNLDLFEYLRELGSRFVTILNNLEVWISTLDFEFNNELEILEKNSSVPMVSQSQIGTLTTAYHTLNTGIMQLSSKASDILYYEFDELKNLERRNSIYFFVINNGLETLKLVVEKTIEQYSVILNNKIGKYLVWYIPITVIIGLAMIIGFGIIVPKLINVQSEKIHILILYTQMNRNQINREIENCAEYQKLAGYMDMKNDNDNENENNEIISRNFSTPQVNDEPEDLDKESEEKNKKINENETTMKVLNDKKKEESNESNSNYSIDDNDENVQKTQILDHNLFWEPLSNTTEEKKSQELWQNTISLNRKIIEEDSDDIRSMKSDNLLEDNKEIVPNDIGDEFDEESIAFTYQKKLFNLNSMRNNDDKELSQFDSTPIQVRREKTSEECAIGIEPSDHILGMNKESRSSDTNGMENKIKSNSSNHLPIIKFPKNHGLEKLKTTIVKKSISDDEYKSIINFNENVKRNKECKVYYNIDYTIPDASRP